MLKQEIVLKEKDGQEIVLTKLPFIIGNFENLCDLFIDDKLLSPIHSQILQEDNELYIQDMNTKEGLLLNGEKLIDGKKEKISNEDEIVIGEKSYIISISSDLITKEEFEKLNNDYQNLLSLEPKEATDKAKKIIEILWEKIIKVNNQIQEENQDLSIQEAVNTYLSNVIKLNVIEDEDQTTQFEAIPEEEDQIEITDFRSSFEKENPRKILVSENNEEPTSELKTRRVQVDLSKLGINENQSSKTLILQERTSPYTEITLENFPCKIGRSYNLADCILDRKGISRVHATILEDNNGNWILRDNNSTNGTFLNGIPVVNRDEIIHPGDTIKFYNYEFLLK